MSSSPEEEAAAEAAVEAVEAVEAQGAAAVEAAAAAAEAAAVEAASVLGAALPALVWWSAEEDAAAVYRGEVARTVRPHNALSACSRRGLCRS
jgi:hypothetical protein